MRLIGLGACMTAGLLMLLGYRSSAGLLWLVAGAALCLGVMMLLADSGRTRGRWVRKEPL